MSKNSIYIMDYEYQEKKKEIYQLKYIVFKIYLLDFTIYFLFVNTNSELVLLDKKYYVKSRRFRRLYISVSSFSLFCFLIFLVVQKFIVLRPFLHFLTCSKTRNNIIPRQKEII
jgi:hypothetical protein